MDETMYIIYKLFDDLVIRNKADLLEEFPDLVDIENKEYSAENGEFWFKYANDGLPAYDVDVWTDIILKNCPKPYRVPFLARIAFLAVQEHKQNSDQEKLRKSGGLYDDLVEYLEKANVYVQKSLNTLDEVKRAGGGPGKRDGLILEYMLSCEETYNDRTSPHISQLDEISRALVTIAGEFKRLERRMQGGQLADRQRSFIGEVSKAYDCVFDKRHGFVKFRNAVVEQTYNEDSGMKERTSSAIGKWLTAHDKVAASKGGRYNRGFKGSVFHSSEEDSETVGVTISRTLRRKQRLQDNMSEEEKKNSALIQQRLKIIKEETGLYGIDAVNAYKEKYGEE